jgi:hypothetical protein
MCPVVASSARIAPHASSDGYVRVPTADGRCVERIFSCLIRRTRDTSGTPSGRLVL